jgi:hypothetical protein
VRGVEAAAVVQVGRQDLGVPAAARRDLDDCDQSGRMPKKARVCQWMPGVVACAVGGAALRAVDRRLQGRIGIGRHGRGAGRHRQRGQRDQHLPALKNGAGSGAGMGQGGHGMGLGRSGEETGTGRGAAIFPP